MLPTADVVVYTFFHLHIVVHVGIKHTVLFGREGEVVGLGIVIVVIVVVVVVQTVMTALGICVAMTETLIRSLRFCKPLARSE